MAKKAKRSGGRGAPASGAAPLAVRWVGDQFAPASLAYVNREICSRLAQRGLDLEAVCEGRPSDGYDEVRFAPLLARAVTEPSSRKAAVHVRHRWPPDFTPPKSGAWVVVQPWEFGGLPAEWLEAMRGDVDEVWCHSTWQLDCYADSGVPRERLRLVPHGVDADLFRPDGPEYPLSNDRAFRFLFVGGTIGRKGIDVAINAYVEAFTAADDVCLVIKGSGSSSFYEGSALHDQLAQLRRSRPDAPAIEYIDADLDHAEIAALYRTCDALVHPYRGEAFGMPVTEAMASGLPVIVSDYGACRDFCDSSTAYLVPTRGVASANLAHLPPSGDLGYWWGEPDRDALATRMRTVASDDAGRAERAEAARHVVANMTWDATADIVAERLGDLAAIRPARARSPLVGVAPVTGPRREAFSAATAPHTDTPFTVVVVARDQADALAETLVSMAETTEDDAYDVVIVDAGSTDHTSILLQGVEGDVNVLQVARDLSLTRAWNRGIDAARGAVVCVVAPGTKFRPGWIAGLEKALAEAPGIGAVGPRVVTPGGMVAEFGRRVHTSGGDAGPVVSARFVGVDAELETPSRDVDAVVPPVVAIRTAAWAECGGLDALLPVEDAFVDLGLRLNVRGWRVVASGDLDVVTANETRAPARRRLSSPLVERWNARVSRRATRGQVSRAASARSRGLNVVGYFTSTFGLGEASRLLLDALVDAGIPVSALNVSFPSLEGDAFPWDPPCPQDVRYETTLMCITPRETAGIKEQMPAQELIARGRTIGYWFWETARFPDMHHHAFAHVDEVWAGSAFTQRAIQKVAPVPVHAVPPPVPEAVAPTHSRADVGLPDRFSFLFMFDYPSLITRKNALGLVEAFVRAFEPGEGPALVVKATNGDRHQRERDALRRAAAAHPDVILIEERLPSEANRDLIALCDSYVSLHRAEGFGLTMAEAMAHGKPVIATEFSGNLDFMSHENSFLVPARTVVTEHPVLGGVVEWGDPDLDAAAAALRTVFGDREEAAARGARARDDLRRYHSVEARGRLIAEILDLGGHVRSGTTEARTGRQAT